MKIDKNCEKKMEKNIFFIMKVLLTSRTESIQINSGKKIGLIGVKTEKNAKKCEK